MHASPDRDLGHSAETGCSRQSIDFSDVCIFVIVEESWRRAILLAQLAAMRYPAKFFPNIATFCAEFDESQHGCLIHDIHSAADVNELSYCPNSRLVPPLIFITADSDAAVVVQVMKQGAVDFLSRRTYADSDLSDAIRRALDIDIERRIAAADFNMKRARFDSLSRADREVIKQLLLGLSNAGVAAALNITEAAAEARRVRLMKKIGAKSFPSLLRFFFENGFDAEL